MIERVYQFLVKDDARAQFELALGPGGAWSKPRAEAQGFRGTTLLRDTENASRFLVIDVWDSEQTRAAAEAEFAVALASLSEILTATCAQQSVLGTFELRAQGHVRPLASKRRQR